MPDSALSELLVIRARVAGLANRLDIVPPRSRIVLAHVCSRWTDRRGAIVFVCLNLDVRFWLGLGTLSLTAVLGKLKGAG